MLFPKCLPSTLCALVGCDENLPLSETDTRITKILFKKNAQYISYVVCLIFSYRYIYKCKHSTRCDCHTNCCSPVDANCRCNCSHLSFLFVSFIVHLRDCYAILLYYLAMYIHVFVCVHHIIQQ